MLRNGTLKYGSSNGSVNRFQDYPCCALGSRRKLFTLPQTASAETICKPPAIHVGDGFGGQIVSEGSCHPIHSLRPNLGWLKFHTELVPWWRVARIKPPDFLVYRSGELTKNTFALGSSNPW